MSGGPPYPWDLKKVRIVWHFLYTRLLESEQKCIDVVYFQMSGSSNPKSS